VKSRVVFHRSYRTLPAPRVGHGLDLPVLVLPLEILLVLVHQPLLRGVVDVARRLIGACGIESTVAYEAFLPRVIESLPVLDLPARHPSAPFSWANLGVALGVLALVPLLGVLPRPLVVYLCFVSLLNAVSAGFFLLFPAHFPYDMVAFSALYLKLALGLWLLLPIVLALVLNPLPGGTPSKLLVVVSTLVYSILFATVRYAFFLYVLHEFSMLYMAAMFFALGPFVDFVYVVAIYSLYVNSVALRLKKEPANWLWLS
jgi:hypothetical protein